MSADTLCLWCHRQVDSQDSIELPDGGKHPIHPEHRSPAEAFLAKASKFGIFFIIAMALGTPIFVVGIILTSNTPVWSNAIMGAMLTFIGVVMVALPFCTPQTVQWLGLRKSIVLARVLGLGMLTWGVATAGFSLLA